MSIPPFLWERDDEPPIFALMYSVLPSPGFERFLLYIKLFGPIAHSDLTFMSGLLLCHSIPRHQFHLAARASVAFAFLLTASISKPATAL